MTITEYRDRMRRYSYETMVMSFVVTDHPDFKALQAAGEPIVPFLLTDLKDNLGFCKTCHGLGYELAPVRDRDTDWQARHAWPPQSTGKPCPECHGVGHVNSWAVFYLLRTNAPGHPVIETWMRGRHEPIRKAWLKWGEENGYLPPTPPLPRRSGFLSRLVKLLSRTDNPTR